MHTQSKLTVAKSSVAIYGSTDVVSGLGAKILKVAQQPFTFSILNTDDVPVVVSPSTVVVYGKVNKVLLQLYKLIGLVL